MAAVGALPVRAVPPKRKAYRRRPQRQCLLSEQFEGEFFPYLRLEGGPVVLHHLQASLAAEGRSLSPFDCPRLTAVSFFRAVRRRIRGHEAVVAAAAAAAAVLGESDASAFALALKRELSEHL